MTTTTGWNLTISSLVSNSKKVMDRIKQGMSATLSVAKQLEQLHQTDDVEELRGVYLNHIRQMHSLQCHSKALASLASLPEAEQCEADLQALLARKLDQLQVAQFEAEKHDAYVKKWLPGIWRINHPNEPVPGVDSDGEGNDELLVVQPDEGQSFVCPISQAVMKEPMKHVRCGHVFDRSSLLGLLRRPGATCPIPGCVLGNSAISESDFEMDYDLKHLISRNRGSTSGSKRSRSSQVEDISDDDDY